MIQRKTNHSILVLAVSTLACVSINAHALDPSSAYVGANLGVSYHDYHEHLKDVWKRIDRDGPAGRLYAGYQVNDLFGVEAGYGRYHSVDFKLKNALINQRGHIRHEALDVLGKFTLPLIRDLKIQGEAGGAYVNARATKGLEAPSILTHGFSDKSFVTPVLGANLVYDVGQGQVELGIRHIEGKHRIRDINFAHIGGSIALG